MSKNILIIGSELDYHAALVAWAVKKKGGEVIYFDTSDYGMEHFLDRSTLAQCEIDSVPSFINGEISAVYNRRFYEVRMDRLRSTEDSKKFVHLEKNTFNRWMLQNFQDVAGCPWINGFDENRAAENKINQLRYARINGLITPKTIVGDDPTIVLDFIASNVDGSIYKPLTGHLWISDGIPVLQTNTVEVNASSLTEEAISVCPGIYQEKVHKSADVRVVIVGDSVYALRYSPKDGAGGSIDYRVYLNNDMTVSTSVEVPQEVQKGLCGLMRSLKISYASADFAISDSGQWVFFELNPAGQFAFVEWISKDLRIVDGLSSFLLYGDPLAGCRDDVRLVDFEESEDFARMDMLSKKYSSSNVFVPDFAMTHTS
ncbi:MAG: hypothetical protein QM581_11920 [Pseudomonas sp.]